MRRRRVRAVRHTRGYRCASRVSIRCRPAVAGRWCWAGCWQSYHGSTGWVDPKTGAHHEYFYVYTGDNGSVYTLLDTAGNSMTNTSTAWPYGQQRVSRSVSPPTGTDGAIWTLDYVGGVSAAGLIRSNRPQWLGTGEQRHRLHPQRPGQPGKGRARAW